MNQSLLFFKVLSVFLFTSLFDSASADDWPHQRGAQMDGSVSDHAKIPASLPDDPKVMWRVPVKDGFASAIISDGRVTYGDLQNGKETFHALELETGEPVWHHAMDGTPHKDGFGTGPRCAPSSNGELTLLQSCKGELHCVNSETGTLIWKKDYLADFGAPYTGEKGKTEGAARHGYTASPIFDGNQIITLVGGPGAGVVCLKAATGDVVWKSQDDQAGYASPLVATLDGVEQVVCFTVKGALGVAREDGRFLWRVPMTTDYGRHVVAPVVIEDTVIVGSHQAGLIATRMTASNDGSMRANQVWKHGEELGPNITSPVQIDGYLYMLVGKNVVCVEASSGRKMWSQAGLVLTNERGAFCGFIAMEDRVLIFTDMGELILFKADPNGYSEISRTQVSGKNWCHPAYADGKLVVRDAKHLICVDLLTGQ